jgi:subtilase family serine protease
MDSSFPGVLTAGSPSSARCSNVFSPGTDPPNVFATATASSAPSGHIFSPGTDPPNVFATATSSSPRLSHIHHLVRMSNATCIHGIGRIHTTGQIHTAGLITEQVCHKPRYSSMPFGLKAIDKTCEGVQMKMFKHLVAGFFAGFLVIGALGAGILFTATPARAAGETCSTGSASPCAEDIQLNGCNACHSIRVTGGNRNGTSRVITGATGTTRHIDDPKISDWTSIVSAMMNKGAVGVLNLTAGYLNTNYCSTCTGPILGSPLQSSITTSGATVTWSTSYIGFEDELTNSVLFYGTVEADVLACTNTAGCPGVSVILNGTPVAHHIVTLTGLTAGTRYYMVNQATSGTHGTTRSTYAVSFKTKPVVGLAIPSRLYISEDETSNPEHDRIVVIDPNPLKLDNTPNPSYNKQIGNMTLTGKDPAEMVAHPDGSTVYAIVGSNISVITIDPITYVSSEFSSLLGVGDLFNHLAITEDGQMLSLVYRDASATTLRVKLYDVADPLNPILMTTISSPLFDGCYGPLGLGSSPNGSRLYVACRPTNTSLPDNFYTVDTATHAVTLTTTFARDSSNNTGINAIAVTPDGTRVYLARAVSGSGSTVEIFDGDTGANIGSIPLPSNALPRAGQVSPDGSRLYVADLVLGIHVIDTSSNTRLLTLTMNTSRGVDVGITADGSRLYSTLGSFVFVNNTATNGWVATITGDYTSVGNLAITQGQSAATAPDVLMTDVTPNASGVSAGSTLSVTDSVKNFGNASTDSAFFIAYSLSPNTTYGDGDDVAIPTSRATGPLAAGVTDTATTNLLIPNGTLPGTYHVCALADSTVALGESNTDNNTLCSTVTVQVTQPDLVMTAVAPTGSSYVAGGTLAVTDTVQNQGSAPTTASISIGYSLSTNSVYGDGDDIAITTTRVVGPLGAGGTSTATTNLLIPSSTPVGTYHVCANADSSNAVSETNESNNSRCSTTTVGSGGIDLIVTAASTTTTAVAPGGSFTLSNSAKNQGITAAGKFIIAFHLSTNTTYGDGDDIVLTATRTLTSLGKGATSTANTSLVIPSTATNGSYYVCVMADRDNTVPETDETNNTLCTATPVQVDVADLVMTAVTPNAATLSTTATLSVTNTVLNQGSKAPISSKVGFKLSPTANYDDSGAIASATTRSISMLANGATSTATTTVTFPNTTPPGTYYVCAKADSLNVLTESDETNNTLCSTGTVTVPQADLIMSILTTTTTSLSPGGNISLANTAKNQGLFPAGSFVIGYDLSPTTNYNDPGAIAITTTRTVTSLAVNASSGTTQNVAIPASTPLGTYYVCAKADVNNTVSESDETNNTRCTTTTVLVTLPDLIMTAVTPNSSQVLPGANFTVTNTEKNIGGATAVGFVVNFHLSTDATYGGGDDIILTGTRPGGTLLAGASAAATTTVTVPSTTPAGNYYVCAMADYDFRLDELDENNNTLCSAITILVPFPDLIVSVASTTTTTSLPNGTISVSNTVKNQGGGAAAASTVAFHLSLDTIYGNGDDLASVTTRTIGTLAANATSVATTSVLVPVATPPGVYYVCVMADSNNVVAESNETNNSLCTATTVIIGPDLTFTALTGPASGTHVAQGATFTVSDTVKNQGGTTTGANTTNVYHLSTDTTYGNGDDIAFVATRTIAALAAGASNGPTNTTLTVPVSTPNGTYYVCAQADSINVVTEANENNNTACTATTIIVP